jgi:NhaA family Na+:H+ antiporter
MAANLPSEHPEFPSRRIEQLTRPFVHFMHVESAGGIVLLACTALALILANSPWAEAYHHFWEIPVSVGVGEYRLSHSLEYWINDALMVVFFFVIGLEIKREMVTGELSHRKQLVLPVAAALGGVVVPVLIYLSRQLGQEGQHGWAVPMATDIAFVVGCLALLGKRIPHGLKILMLSLAIVDDLAAVAVIAVFYTDEIHAAWLAGAVGGLALIATLTSAGVRAVGVYAAMGVVVWFCMLKSGVHPTIAGVLIGLLTPVRALLPEKSYLSLLVRTHEQLSDESLDANQRRRALSDLAFATHETVSPVVRMESALHPWVAFVIMPLFALANAGVAIDAGALGQPVAVAVALGLFAGKATGIFLASWLTIKLGWTVLPRGVSWGSLLGAAFLGGIGFTMALFIAALGLQGALLDAAKVGVVVGSFVSACVGMLILTGSSARTA